MWCCDKAVSDTNDICKIKTYSEQIPAFSILFPVCDFSGGVYIPTAYT